MLILFLLFFFFFVLLLLLLIFLFLLLPCALFFSFLVQGVTWIVDGKQVATWSGVLMGNPTVAPSIVVNDFP